MDLAALIASMPMAAAMDIELKSAAARRVEASMRIRADQCTVGAMVQGGALMALADSVAAIGAFLTLPEGAKGTTTIESKTNFLGPAAAGDTLSATAEPVSAGRRVSVWQTRIRRSDGRDVALVIQTQLVL